MPIPITLKPHLSTDELYLRYRACRHPQEKVRWRALYLISQGEQANRAARRVGRTSGWITQLARRYNERGAEAVPNQKGDRRSGGKPHLDTTATEALDQALRSHAPDGGLWTAPKVAAWIAERTARWCMRRPPGVTCAASALPCKCHVPSIGVVPLWRSKPISKKARRHDS